MKRVFGKRDVVKDESCKGMLVHVFFTVLPMEEGESVPFIH
jgi:hypothetical protein